jgi:transcriptional regulator with XRE-family HTH domain
MVVAVMSHEKVDQGIIDRVNHVIGASGLTQKGFAEKIGMDPTKLSKSLNLHREFATAELCAIATLAAVSLDWLIRGASS